MEETIESLQKKISHYEKMLGIAEYDPAIRGYRAYVKIINQQIEHIENFNISNNIEGKKSDTALYDRTESMWKALPDMVSKLNALRIELKIEYNPEDNKVKQLPVSPQSIGVK